MLKLFGGNKVDHPLADPEELQRLLKALPAQTPPDALEGAGVWYESLATSVELKPERRAELLFLLDETVVPQTRRSARDYLLAPRQTRAQEYLVWQINHRYWSRLAVAYEAILNECRNEDRVAAALRPQLPRLCARHLNACGNRVKWLQFRYGPADAELWRSAGQTWLEAQRRQIAGVTVKLYANTTTTTEAEYLRLLVFHASSPESLLPVEIEITERLIAHLLNQFHLTDLAKPENVYWVDPNKALPPTRLARIPEITPTLRFFATHSALKALGELRAQIETRGELPPEVNFGAQYAPRLVLEVIAHLALCWAPVPPMRHHERRTVKSRMAVVGRFDPILAQLSGQAHSAGAEGTVVGAVGAAGAAAEAPESWVVDNVSLGGIGAQVSLVGKDWLRVGSLLAMQPEGGAAWLIGVVRRFVRQTDSVGIVGIETLSKNPLALVADSLGLPTPVILLDTPQPGAPVRLAMTVAAWQEQKRLRLNLNGMPWRLTPLQQDDGSSGHVIGRFQAELDD